MHHAVALDPLTAALFTLEDARAMTAELLAAHADRLPEGLLQAAPAQQEDRALPDADDR